MNPQTNLQQQIQMHDDKKRHGFNKRDKVLVWGEDHWVCLQPDKEASRKQRESIRSGNAWWMDCLIKPLHIEP